MKGIGPLVSVMTQAEGVCRAPRRGCFRRFMLSFAGSPNAACSTAPA